jgi:thermostable 8-oxoguanine DNA glycosylase
MQVFLGTSMVCAQCHDHPFDRWTQMDFYKLAAFTSGVTSRRGNIDKSDPRAEIFRDIRMDAKSDVELNKISKEFFDVLFSGVVNSGTGLIRLPHDYQYDDSKPHDIIKAETPYGPKVALEFSDYSKDLRLNKKLNPGKKNMPAPGEDIDSRKAFADWVTSKENPMFTKTIVNRMWDKMMGAPLVGPLLNITSKTDGANKELTEKLISIMKDVNYDLRAFIKVIANSQTYQRQSLAEDSDVEFKNYFQGPALKRLTAEQLWDSMLSLALENPDAKLPIGPVVDTREIIFTKLSEMKPEELKKTIMAAKDDGKGYFKQFASEAQEMNMSMMSSMASTTSTISQSDQVLKNARARYEELKNQSKKLDRKKDADKALAIREEMEKLRTTMAVTGKKNQVAKNSARQEFSRASEVQSPAPANHFLRRFGQSDREIIDGASLEASVPQALTLLNGKVEDYLIRNPVSMINRSLDVAKTPAEGIRAAFLSILSREPNAQEMAMFTKRFEKDPTQARQDIVWVLVNSNEFMFNQ